jgi:Secretion system C-terminal sorting domain
MKKHLLFLFFIILASLNTNAQSLINYSATLFYNSTNNTVQVTFYVQNTNNGNGVWVDLAAIQFSIRYNTTYFTLASYSMYPEGSGLDAAGDSNSDQPDATSTTPVTIGGKNYQSLNISRSANICNNVLRLAPGSATYPVFVANFQLTVAGINNGYDFTTPTSNDYPAEFQVAGSPTTTKKDILFQANSSADQNGTANSCSDGNIKLKSLSDDPSTPTVFTNSNGPLPVKWGSFAAVKQNNNYAVLYWTTETEINSAGFEIQQKTNNTFEGIGYVPSKAYKGNSSGILNYSLSNVALPSSSAITYFRIKQIGFDKSVSYSEIKAVHSNNKILQVLVYPNPGKGSINVILPADFSGFDISLVDISGKVQRVWKNYQKQNLPLNNLANGFYLLNGRSHISGESFSEKITVF